MALSATLAALLIMGSVGAPVSESTVGMTTRIDQLVIPGPELEVKPLEDRDAPLRLRIIDVYPHGPNAFRYDLEFTGLEPGSYDLRHGLRRKDGQPMDATAKGPFIRVLSVLPSGQVPPRDPASVSISGLGGYRTLLAILGLIWLIGLVALIWSGRRKRDEAVSLEQSRPRTLAERLRPLVDQASAGTLDSAGLAELERLLLGHWSRRLGLEDRSPAETFACLRQHEEAGPLIRRLEQWLHAPGSSTSSVDPATLLAPYRDLPDEPVRMVPNDAISTGGPAR